MRNSNTLNIVKISIMTVIIILCGWITIPAPIPFTLQTFGIYAAVLLIGSKRALISLILYILTGLVGLPVFSNFSSGIGHLLSPTGGYILGFIFCPLVCLLGEKLCKKEPPAVFPLCAGTLMCYTLGTLWFSAAANMAEAPSGLWNTLMLCVLPYIIPDALKLSAAYFLAKKLKPILLNSNKD